MSFSTIKFTSNFHSYSKTFKEQYIGYATPINLNLFAKTLFVSKNCNKKFSLILTKRQFIFGKYLKFVFPFQFKIYVRK